MQLYDYVFILVYNLCYLRERRAAGYCAAPVQDQTAGWNSYCGGVEQSRCSVTVACVWKSNKRQQFADKFTVAIYCLQVVATSITSVLSSRWVRFISFFQAQRSQKDLVSLSHLHYYTRKYHHISWLNHFKYISSKNIWKMEKYEIFFSTALTQPFTILWSEFSLPSGVSFPLSGFICPDSGDHNTELTR